jgi:ABC-type transport system involved in cytochrome bd biosynthesis fused ATPase/permease subunit
VSFAFLERQNLAELTPVLLLGVSAWIIRTTTSSLQEWVNRTSGLRTVASIRATTTRRILNISRHELPAAQGSLVALLTRGIEGLEVYMARYLPQLVASAIVPLGIGAVIFWLDPLSAVILLLTIPLIPLFMALVGWFTSSNVEKHWQQVTRLSATLADLMNGLPELKIFGRARAQAKEIERLGTDQQIATMRMLRLSFLSAFVLELLSTISVAIVAVAVGLRLVEGEMQLWKGLAALILAPEVYAPLRMVGVHFHAAADGIEAWNQVKAVLDTTERKRGDVTPTGEFTQLTWDEMTLTRGNRTLQVEAGVLRPGEIVAITGPSGSGKSTFLEVVLNNFIVISPSMRWLTTDAEYTSETVSDHWLSAHLGYVGQNAWLAEGTVQSTVEGGTVRDTDAIKQVLADLSLELDLAAPISDRSQGVSVGQRRRLAAARALLRRPSVLILDEPAAALDDESERALLAVIRKFTRAGGAVLIVAHRPAVVEIAHREVRCRVAGAA